MSKESSLDMIDETRNAFSLGVQPIPHDMSFSVYPTHGFLHQDGNRWIATDDQLTTPHILPSFIHDRESAFTFLHYAYKQFKLGVKIGTEAKERELANKGRRKFWSFLKG